MLNKSVTLNKIGPGIWVHRMKSSHAMPSANYFIWHNWLHVNDSSNVFKLDQLKTIPNIFILYVQCVILMNLSVTLYATMQLSTVSQKCIFKIYTKIDIHDSVYFCEGNCYVSLYRICQLVSKCLSLTKLDPFRAFWCETRMIVSVLLWSPA